MLDARRPIVDFFGVLLWVYGILKVFVADIDRQLLGGVVSRFFFFVGAAVINTSPWAA